MTNFMKRLKILRLNCSILALLFTVISFGQTNWYVDKQNGSNSNDGQSVNSALKTIEYISDTLASSIQPGDTIFIIGEYANDAYDPNYEFTGNINDPYIWSDQNSFDVRNLNGSSNQYITLKPYDESTILKGDSDNIFRMVNCSYVRIDGFEIYGEVENISLQTALDLQFVYRESGSQNSVYRVQPGTPANEVANMTFPILDDISRPFYTDTRGMYITNSHHIDIINNLIHHTSGNGLRVARGDYINIIGNEIHDCSRKSYSGTHGMVVTLAESMDNNEGHKINILNNIVHHNYNEIYSWAPTKDIITPKIDEGKGISMQRNQPSTGWTHGRFLIANNITYWNGYSGVHSNTGHRMDFINNTCYMNSYTNTVTYANGDQSGNNIGISASNSDDIRIYNNISTIDAAWGGFPISVRSTTNFEVGNNLSFGLNDTLSFDNDLIGIEVNRVEGNPFFMDAENFNFNLLENSPAIGMANEAFAPATDFYGKIRNGNPDLGAIESDFLLSIGNLEEEKIEVFPNPFSEQIFIKDMQVETNEIEIYNLIGQSFSAMVFVKNDDGKIEIDTAFLPIGAYVLKLRDRTQVVFKYTPD